ncbi:hypothetical protein GGS26DRAFT_598995 [Hypomontagnella submonticulosa]|nr:hypothetical protein GGS26DRAFT_598995 [Hypomontagnella submonticulosa]
MPIFITCETYACAHVQDTRDRTLGADGTLKIETIAIPSRCLACLCESALQTCFALDHCYNYEYDDGPGVHRVSPPYIRQLAKHLQTLLEQKRRCAATGVHGADYRVEFELARRLEELSCSVLTSEGAGEFTIAFLALMRLALGLQPGVTTSVDQSL